MANLVVGDKVEFNSTSPAYSLYGLAGKKFVVDEVLHAGSNVKLDNGWVVSVSSLQVVADPNKKVVQDNLVYDHTSSPLYDSVYKVVDDMVACYVPFTAYDVTKELRVDSPSTYIGHNEVAGVVHGIMDEVLLEKDTNYKKTLINTGKSQPFLYHHVSYDPAGYAEDNSSNSSSCSNCASCSNSQCSNSEPVEIYVIFMGVVR